MRNRKTKGAFHSAKNSEISGSKLNGTVKIPGKVFENLGLRFEFTLFLGISGIKINCQLDSAQCALFLVSIMTDTLPSHPEMVFELPRQIRWNSYFEVPIYKS